jgi:hypothetical protein
MKAQTLIENTNRAAPAFRTYVHGTTYPCRPVARRESVGPARRLSSAVVRGKTRVLATYSVTGPATES